MNRAPLDAIVLAGGRGSRLGGVDKGALLLRDERLIDRVVDAVRGIGIERIVVVGSLSAAPPGTVSVREDPPFSGPLAALAEGLDALDTRFGAETGASEWVLLLACDLEHPAAVCDALAVEFARLPRNGTPRDSAHGGGPHENAPRDGARGSDRLGGERWDGVLLEDPDGRPQWLAGIYRASSLRAGLGAAGSLDDRPLRLAFSGARLIRLPAPSDTIADIDTPEDLARARRAAAKERP
ncbi:molybdenum cofactor guanylyltransferase [Leucobacter tenebrionis]|uniref:molybdenum cofactor guanylyltransferase n=1 Tax=Leucobacter tenebrionis TaxID=2873270 RepID=UPI001CA774C8|nr:NTP transferase domain-containing protein [Leucobacter tenebrionis]QZY52840.1 NTP transferase domain-containing protein [Leucobacter tenebrionis]